MARLRGWVMRSSLPLLLAALLPGTALLLASSANAQETLTLQTIHPSGANLTTSTAQVIDLSAATNQPLFAAALKGFNALNSDIVLQNASSFTGGGQAVSPQFFPYLSSSVSVNSQVYAAGGLATGGARPFAFEEFGRRRHPRHCGGDLPAEPRDPAVPIQTTAATSSLSRGATVPTRCPPSLTTPFPLAGPEYGRPKSPKAPRLLPRRLTTAFR